MKRIRYDYTFGIPVKVNIVEISFLGLRCIKKAVDVLAEALDIHRDWCRGKLADLIDRLLL